MTMHTVALVPGAFKPMHVGHFELIGMASKECDEVFLFVSLQDRARKGELSIRGADMRKVWEDYLMDAVAEAYPNVHVVLTEKSPVALVFEKLTELDSQGDVVVKIYADVVDIEKYALSYLSKAAPRLTAGGRIVKRGVRREETTPVSGTKMREYLAAGDVKSFARMLPPPVRGDAKEIVRVLKGGSDESSLMEDVRRTMASSKRS